jgi:DNA-binding transcriptional ArsR family regulator
MNIPFLTALAEPNRMRIIELLRDGPRPVGVIASQLGLRQPQASKHLKVLTEAGLVMVQPYAQQRIYKLLPGRFEDLDCWLETFRHIWDARLNNLDEYLQEVKAEQKKIERR